VTISFAGYAYQSQMQAFGDWVVSSKWLANICSEYRCGTGTHVAKIVIPDAPPAVVGEQDIVSFLLAQMQNGVVPRPPTPENDWFYVIYYPASTRVDAPGFTGCQTGGFHYFARDGQTRFAYSPIPDCAATRLPGWTPLEAIEENASHELIEAVTDPYGDGFYLTDPQNPRSIFEGEIADYCVGNTTEEAGFTATRVWSNRAAAMGLDPCQPAPPVPYFNVSAAAKVEVPTGGSATFSVTGWSTAERAPWDLVVGGWLLSAFDPMAKLSGSRLNNGDMLTVTVSSPAGTPSGTRGSLMFYSYDKQSGPYATWPVLLEVR
jgi:hypothetical protein